jgi:hypothetical protein
MSSSNCARRCEAEKPLPIRIGSLALGRVPKCDSMVACQATGVGRTAGITSLREGGTPPCPAPDRLPPTPEHQHVGPMAQGDQPPHAPGGISAPPHTSLGPAPVSPRVLHRDLMDTHQGDDQRVHRRIRWGAAPRRQSISNRRPSEPTASQALVVQSSARQANEGGKGGSVGNRGCFAGN